MNFQAFVHPLVWLRLYIVHKLQVCALVWGNICQILWCIPMIGKFTIIYFEEVETVKILVNTCWQWFLICWAAKPRKLQRTCTMYGCTIWAVYHYIPRTQMTTLEVDPKGPRVFVPGAWNVATAPGRWRMRSRGIRRRKSNGAMGNPQKSGGLNG